VFGFSKKKRAEEEYDVEEYDEYDDYDEYDEYDDYDEYDEAEDTEGIDEDEYDTEEEDKAENPVPAYVEDESLKVIVYDRTEGPLDMDEVEDTEDYANLGSVYIKLLDGMRLRLEVEEASGVVIAATCIRKGATIQIQAFAAPRSSGIWDDIREELAESVASQGGTVEMYEGVFGVEMLTRLPAVTEDGLDISSVRDGIFTVLPIPPLAKPAVFSPAENETFGANFFKTNRSIVFRWKKNAEATHYSIKLYNAKNQKIFERNIDANEASVPSKADECAFTFTDLAKLSRGTFYADIRAQRRLKNGLLFQDGNASVRHFVIDLPQTQKIETDDTGVLYGR